MAPVKVDVRYARYIFVTLRRNLVGGGWFGVVCAGVRCLLLDVWIGVMWDWWRRPGLVGCRSWWSGRGVDGGARGAVAVVAVPVRWHVELPTEQIVRNRLRSVIVLGRRRVFF
ncbi:hypothetical protein, partial [Streptomyces sp. uw30]|uniref:hypothetical protein n=1 Tax=Streptomyces sp. uw30 TaxID=1828179 RepID=UPI001C9C89C6